MKFAVIQFPGSNCDQDCVYVLDKVLGQEVELRWHKDSELGKVDAVVLPGGFSYGDYLRTGAIARFSPVMKSVIEFASDGGLVLGICNGFQILCESGLLPGALIRNRSLQFRCETVFLQTAQNTSPFTSGHSEPTPLRLPIAHGEGCYFADAETLATLQRSRRILWRYVDASGDPTPASNPNGSVDNIAGICNEAGNVAGLMPHPERACEKELGSEDGRTLFSGMIRYLTEKRVA